MAGAMIWRAHTADGSREGPSYSRWRAEPFKLIESARFPGIAGQARAVAMAAWPVVLVLLDGYARERMAQNGKVTWEVLAAAGQG